MPALRIVDAAMIEWARDVSAHGGLGDNIADIAEAGGEIIGLALHRVEMLGRPRRLQMAGRSDERRVGKECVSKCRSRWSQAHKTKQEKRKQQRRQRNEMH